MNFEEMQNKNQKLLNKSEKKLQIAQKEYDEIYNRAERRQQKLNSIGGRIERLLFEDGNVNKSRYDARNKFFKDLGFMSSGYRPDTSQVALKIMLYRDESFDKIQDSIKLVLPYIKPIKGRKIFGILEKSLSEYGVYELVYEDGTWYITKTVYGNERDIGSFKDLEKCLSYIQKNLYYE